MEGQVVFDEMDSPDGPRIKREETQVATRATIALSDAGLPVPKNIEEEFRLADALFKGGGLPQWVKNPVQAFVAAQYCRAFGFQPIVGVQFIQLVNGRISLWGEGPLAAVRNSNKLEWIREYFLAADYREISVANKNLDEDVFAAVCVVKRVGSQQPKETTFTSIEADQVKQGIAEIWKKWRPIMMKRKARAIALKDEFGDVLLGMPIAEYNFHTAPDMPRESITSLVDKLNSRLNEKLDSTAEGKEDHVLSFGMPGDGA